MIHARGYLGGERPGAAAPPSAPPAEHFHANMPSSSVRHRRVLPGTQHGKQHIPLATGRAHFEGGKHTRARPPLADARSILTRGASGRGGGRPIQCCQLTRVARGTRGAGGNIVRETERHGVKPVEHRTQSDAMDRCPRVSFQAHISNRGDPFRLFRSCRRQNHLEYSTLRQTKLKAYF
jgi:hypothetical protein